METSRAMESELKYFGLRYIMFVSILIFSACICMPSPLSAAAQEPDRQKTRQKNSDDFLDVAPVLERFYAAVYNFSEISFIEDTYTEASSAIAREIDNSYLRLYLTAKADAVLGRHFGTEGRPHYDPKKAKKLLQQAVLAAEQALKLQETPEAYALLSEANGSIFILAPFRYLLSYGPRSQKAAAEAEKLGADSLPVLLLQGNTALYAPELYGGDPQEAYTLFQQALDICRQRKEQNVYISPMDEFTIYSSLGIALIKLEREDAAAEWLKQALAVYPNNPYAAEFLESIL